MMPIAVHASDQFVTKKKERKHYWTQAQIMWNLTCLKKPNHESNTMDIIATIFVLPLPSSTTTTTNNNT